MSLAPRPLSHLVLLAALGGAASSSPHASAAPVITPRDAPGAVMPDRSWDVQHVSLAVQLDLDAGTVTGTVSHRVAPLARGSSWMRLHQAGLTLSEVLVDGKPAQYRQSQYSLDVVMPVDQPGEHVVTVSWSTKPETGLHFRGQPGSVDGYRAAWSQGEDEDNRYWLPLWDSPNDAFTLDTKVTVRDGLGAWANGSLDSVTPRGDGWTTHAFHLDQPIVGYLVAVVAGEYQELEATAPCPEGLVGCAPLPLTYIVPRSWSAADAEATFAATPRVIRFLEGLLQQPYPYPIYRQAIAPRFIYQGMENASLTTIRDSLALKPGDARRYRTDEVVAHEAAHQWFGDLVTCESWRDLWLNEGFATYYAGRFLRADEGAEAYSIEHRSWRQAALRRAAPMSARAWSIGDEGPNTGVYVRGASVLHSLESLLGPETFDAAIADYVHQHRFQLVRTEDLREVLEAHSGKDLAWFFDAWVHGRGWPELTTHWGHRDGELSISINQTSTAKSGQFYAPIDVLVGLANGDELKRTVWLGAGETQLVLPTDVPPAYVAIDPNGTLIGVIKQQQDPAAWLAQLQRVSTPDAKLDAINALIAGVPDQPALDAISEQLRSTTHHPIWRAEVAKQLGHLKTEGGLRVLASAAKDAHPVVREAVADALATASHVELATGTLTALLRDPHPVVRASALAALVKHDPQAALREAKRNLGQPKLDDTIRRMALYVLAEAGDEKDIALALRFTDARYERGVRIQAGEAAHTHASALDEQQQQAAYERILDAVLPNLHDPDLRMREATIELVGAVGGEEARTALRALLAETLHPEVRAEIEDAIAQSWNHDPATPAKPTPTELQDVQTELDAIKKRLKDVEAWR